MSRDDGLFRHIHTFLGHRFLCLCSGNTCLGDRDLCGPGSSLLQCELGLRRLEIGLGRRQFEVLDSDLYARPCCFEVRVRGA